MEAQDWCRKYQMSRNVKDLTQAWDLYYHVFRRITKQLPQVQKDALQFSNQYSQQVYTNWCTLSQLGGGCISYISQLSSTGYF